MGRVSAGQHLDAAGGLVPSDSAALREEWLRLREAAPEDFATAPPAVAAWRNRQAAEAEAAGQWFAAAWHLDHLLADRPDDADTRRRRAAAAANLGDWKRAADDAGKAVRAQPANPDNWYQRGVALGQLGRWDRAAADFALAVRLKTDPAAAVGLAAKVKLDAGDLPGYRQACRELLDRHRSAADPRAALSAAWACVLSPESGADPSAVVQLAEAGLKSAPADPFARTVHAAALLRAGRSAEAAAELKAVSATDGDHPAAWLVYALALSRQGDAASASAWRAKAEAWLARASAPGAVPPTWDQRADAEVLLKEVK
jgi:tetratricopeptide (TPR) repeat protein